MKGSEIHPTYEFEERAAVKKLFEEDIEVIAAEGRKYGKLFGAQYPVPEFKETVRTFSTGATRSPLGDKLQYEGYMNPLVLKRFAEYMKVHQTQSDGTQRDAANWQRGIPAESLIDSAWRHFEDVWLYHRGYEDCMEESIEEALCALFFFVQADLLRILEEKRMKH